MIYSEVCRQLTARVGYRGVHVSARERRQHPVQPCRSVSELAMRGDRQGLFPAPLHRPGACVGPRPPPTGELCLGGGEGHGHTGGWRWIRTPHPRLWLLVFLGLRVCMCEDRVRVDNLCDDD